MQEHFINKRQWLSSIEYSTAYYKYTISRSNDEVTFSFVIADCNEATIIVAGDSDTGKALEKLQSLKTVLQRSIDFVKAYTGTQLVKQSQELIINTSRKIIVITEVKLSDELDDDNDISLTFRKYMTNPLTGNDSLLSSITLHTARVVQSELAQDHVNEFLNKINSLIYGVNELISQIRRLTLIGKKDD